MTLSRHYLSLAACALAALAAPALAQQADVARIAPDRVEVSWTGAKAVDLYRLDRPGAPLAPELLVSANDRDGHETVTLPAGSRALFAVRDHASGKVIHIAERLIPLEQGSNFRDIGGYPAAEGKTVRWGLIYRSGATPLLSDNDRVTISKLGLANLVDLRSDEERQLAPPRIDGVRYSAIGYSLGAMMPKNAAELRNGAELYRNFPQFFAPQLKLVFELLEKGDGPLQFNCSAGQDRTGFTAAMVLSALGTPREVIVADYLKSTALRRPEFEMPHFDPAAFPGNPVAQLFAAHPDSAATPLVEADGTPFLAGAFAEIEARWGSVDAYLQQEVGLTPERIAALRARYTE
jgi:protein-tyrosine phosphatase